MARPAEVIKSLLIGRPKDTSQLEHERLNKTVALAVFASDNLSSAAYATEEMLDALVKGGLVAAAYSLHISLALVAVVAIIAFSYRGTIHAYPNGGGAYIVAHENLGKIPGLVAAASLLVDYILTVSVSVAAGVANIVAFAPGLDHYRVIFALVVIWFITMMNLRGIRESGAVFAVPTYAFILLLGATIIVGLVKYFFFHVTVPPPDHIKAIQSVGIILILNAFARGSAAVTGIEAISNGIPAFKEPASENASKTLVAMASLLAFLFMGITLLAHFYHVVQATKTQTVVGLVAHRVWGGGPIFVAVLGATALILFLAANTSYADFPRLSAVLARDRFWPRQFMNRGDRLAFSNGILGLAVFASGLIIIFNADVTRLINLYVMGVFTALTLSQFGMVRHWRREHQNEPRWKTYLAANAIGGVTTFIVLCIVLPSRFTKGGYMVVIAVPILVAAMNRIHRHYNEVGVQLRAPHRRPSGSAHNHVVLLVGTPSREEERAFWYGERIKTDDFRMVHIAQPDDPKNLESVWSRQIGLLPTTPSLQIVTGNNSLTGSVRAYIERMRVRCAPDDFITVIVAERVRQHGVFSFGTPTGLRLKLALLLTPGVVVTNVPYISEGAQSNLGPDGSVRHVALALVPAAHNASLYAIEYAKTLAVDEIHALHVTLDPEKSEEHVAQWNELDTGVPLELVESPHRRLAAPVRAYIRALRQQQPTLVTVLIPEFVVGKWWQRFLHNQNAFDLKWSLIPEPDVVVTSVPYHLEAMKSTPRSLKA